MSIHSIKNMHQDCSPKECSTNQYSPSDEIDDWDAADVRPKQGRVENLLYLNDEDEEEGDDPEQEHDGRKVMVRNAYVPTERHFGDLSCFHTPLV